MYCGKTWVLWPGQKYFLHRRRSYLYLKIPVMSPYLLKITSIPKSRNLPFPGIGGPRALYLVPTLTGILLIYLNYYPEHLLVVPWNWSRTHWRTSAYTWTHSNALPSRSLGRCRWVSTRWPTSDISPLFPEYSQVWCVWIFYAHLQKLGTVPTSILKLDNSTKSRLTETI